VTRNLTDYCDTAKGHRVSHSRSLPLLSDRDMAHATKQSGIDVERFRQRLLQLEQETRRKIGRDVELARESADDQPVDQAVVDEVRDEHLVLAQTDTEVLAQIRAALERIENGTYGHCVVDNEPIEPARLEAVPWAPYCARHQREAEARAGLRTPRS
jgi:RNA polymerase-binding transcription factor DksA